MSSFVRWIKRNRIPITVSVLALLAYTAVALVLTWPLAADPGSRYFSPEVPGDGMGLIAETWYAKHSEELGQTEPVTTFYGFPFGNDRRGIPAYPLDTGLRNQLARLTDAQTAYNAQVFFSFPLAGLLMFLLVYYLTRSYAASFFGGFIYAFSPWHTARAFDQASLTGIHTLPLFLLALIFFWRRRDVISTIGLAAASVVAFYTDFHFGLFCAFIAICWAAAAFLIRSRDIRTGRADGYRPRGKAAGTVLMVSLCVVVVLVCAAPILGEITYMDPEAFPGTGRNEVEEATEFSADPWNYVVPPAHSLAWRWFSDDFVRPRLGLRTSNEVTSYPGIVTYALAAVAVLVGWGAAARFGRRRMRDTGPPGGKAVRWNTLTRTTLLFSFIGAVAAFVLSLPPYYKVGSVRLPTPSILVGYAVPFFRYFCRWSLVVTFSLCIMASLGLYLLLRGRSSRVFKAVACLLMVALFAADVTIVPPLRAKITDDPPEVIEELADHPESEPVAVYPMAQGSEYATLHYRYLQQFHRHPMLNGTKPGTESDLFRMAVKDVYSAYTPRMLAGLGISKVVVLNEYYSDEDYGNYPYGVEFDPERMPDGYRLLNKTDDGYIYEVSADPASVYPLYYEGFTPPAILEDGSAWTAMIEPSARMKLVNTGDAGLYSFTVTVAAPGGEGDLVLKLDGEPLTSIRLNPGVVRLTVPDIPVSGQSSVLSVEWSGDPYEENGARFRSAGTLEVYLLLSEPELQAEE